jgi:hypothetical protein
MLKDVLSKINKEGYLSKSILANQLHTSEQMIEESINQLLRMGYLSEDEPTTLCSTACGKCPFAQSCSKEFVKMFRLTTKGKTLLG